MNWSTGGESVRIGATRDVLPPDQPFYEPEFRQPTKNHEA